MDTLKPGWIQARKPPAGASLFGSSRPGAQDYMVYRGKLYSQAGEPLPLDKDFLKRNGYHLCSEALRELVPADPKPETKKCSECATELPVGARYCHYCASPQKVWTPGSGGVGDTIARLISDEDPEAMLEALATIQEGPSREVPPDHSALEPTPEDALAALAEIPLTRGGIPGVPGEPILPLNARYEDKDIGPVPVTKPTTKKNPKMVKVTNT